MRQRRRYDLASPHATVLPYPGVAAHPGITTACNSGHHGDSPAIRAAITARLATL